MITRLLLPFRPLLLLVVLALAGASAARAQFEMRGSGQNRLFISNTVVGLSVTNGGSGYTTAPTVTISGGSGSGATATAIMNGVSVTGFTLTNAGSGYDAKNPPVVTFSVQSGATSAKAVVVFRSIPDGTSPAAITPQFASLAANSTGSTARNADTNGVSIPATAAITVRYPAGIYLISGTTAPTGTAFVLHRSLVGGSFASGVPRFLLGEVIGSPSAQDGGVITAGPTYWRAQPVLVGESFAQAATNSTDTPIALTLGSIKVVTGGAGYTSAPTVSFTGGGSPSTSAIASAVLAQGVVIAINLTNIGVGYTSLPAVTLSGGGGTGATALAASPPQAFYFSPHAGRVFATQSGSVAITWVTRIPVTTATDQTAKYRFKQEIFAVSSTTAQPTRTIYWTEKSFNGPLINIPLGKIETVNPVFNSNFPDKVVQEYQGVGLAPPANLNIPPELRTLWFDKTAGIGQLHAHNVEGRVFVEYLGALQQGADANAHLFLGADIIDTVRVATAVEITVNLGDRIAPRNAGGDLLPVDGSSEWLGSAVSSVSTSSMSFYGSLTRKDGMTNYYAERENLTPDRVAFYWLEQSDAAINFYAAPSAPNLGIYWPRIKNHYLQVWPSDVTKFTHYTVPSGGSTPATGLAFGGGQAPQLVFQDDPDASEARIDSTTQRFVVTFSGTDGLNRSLLKFSNANEVWYIRLFTQMENRPRTIAVTNGGTGYTSAPTVSFTSGGTGAAATASIAGGKVTSIALTTPGQNFTAATQVVLTGGGSSSSATAIISTLGFLESDALSALNAPASVGDRINAPAGYEIGGYIAGGDGYNPAAYADPFTVGMTEAARRAIIPVNAVPGRNVLKVWWFKKVQPTSASFQAFFVPAKIGTYTIAYPANPAKIVLASNAGSGDLSGAEIAGSLYIENIRTNTGFNPNEEHALMLAGRIYALRDDLNNTTTTSDAAAYTSEPFALLSYTHPTDNRPAMRAFKIGRELDVDGTVDDKLFNYPVTAGTIIQGPMPLPLLPLPVVTLVTDLTRGAVGAVVNLEVPGIQETAPHPTSTSPSTKPSTSDYAKFTFEDRKGYDWVYRGPHGAAPVNSVSIANAGSGYTSAPTISFTGGNSSTGAAATATVDGGKIVAITVTTYGVGYSSAPAVTFTGGGGTGAAAVANVGPTLGMQFYYTMREGFFIPALTTQPAVGTILPYLRPIVNGVPSGDPVSGTSLTIVYRPVWPSNAAELRIAETLALPKFGLPALLTQTSANVLYDQSIATLGTAKPSVTLHDPIREKTFALGASGQLSKIPDSIVTSDYQGKTYFTGVPPHLQKRLFYDPTRPTKGALVLLGKFVDEIAGEDYIDLNVLTAEDVAALKALCLLSDTSDGSTTKSKWEFAIDGLATKVETHIENPFKPGTYIAATAADSEEARRPVTVDATTLATSSRSDTAVVNYALTATGKGSGWVSLIFGNGQAFTPTGEPVSVAVFKVAPRLNTGELKVQPSSNPLDEMVAMRHSGDFAAKPEDYEFEWRYAPPQDGVAPPIYTFSMAAVAATTWQFVANPASALPTDSEWAAAPSARSLPFTLALRTDAARAVTLPARVARMSGSLDFSERVPGRIVFSTDLEDTNAGFVLYVNGAAALAYQAPAPFANVAAASSLVSGALTRQFEVHGDAFQVGTNSVQVALFTSSPVNAAGTVNFRFDVSTETDRVAGSTTWQRPNGTLSSQVVVGGAATAPLGSPLLVLTDNYFTMRYRPKINTDNILATGSDQAVVGWSRWMRPALVEGWIKRVLAGINPFNQRISDLYNNAINTDVSLLTQAGKRWEGNVSLNLANIDQFGLIEIYETVLNRGKNISVDSGYDYAPANDALLLAAGYLNDLYTLLGNEAYADAANPTISIDDSTTVTEINTSRFSFEGQVKSVLDEELVLLRGRDDFLSPGVTVSPAYNRLYWNYTRGINSGEALYASNYNIREKTGSATADGKIDAADAQRMFPQAHGDAYGHYLSALKGYTRLLQHSNFTWTPRSEAVTVLGQPIQVDYVDERKFAAAALNVARTGQQILALSHRQSYKDDAAAGWSHFRDAKTNSSTGVTRHWGLDEWTARSTQGAYYNWVLGNSILPDVDNQPQHTGIQIIDRTTVPELLELPVLADDFQAKIDAANVRLNPLGLSPSAIAFDISPSELKSGKSHFDQIYERSLRAVTNAKGAFDQAARMTRLLRNQENQISDSNDAIVDQESAFAGQLVEIFGRPYPSEIGAGKIYAQGYEGPDLYQWFIVDRPSDIIDTSTAQVVSLRVPTDVVDFSTTFSLDAVADYLNNRGLYADKFKTRSFTVQPDRFVQFSDVFSSGISMGKRPVVGTLQQALLESDQARVDLRAATASYAHQVESMKRQIELARIMCRAHADSVAKESSSGDKIYELRIAQISLEAASGMAANAAEMVAASLDAASEAPPKSVGLSSDATSAIRSALKMAGAQGYMNIMQLSTLLAGVASRLEVQQEKEARSMEQAIAAYGFSYEQAQLVYENELALRDLITATYEIAQLATAVQLADENVRNIIATGNGIQADRETFRRRAAAKIQGYRTKDITFRTFRNESLEQYRSLFDLASRYTYLAAKSYDYETGLLGSTAGQSVMNAIVASRALGDLTGGVPQATVSTLGDAGLAGTMARLQADWSVAKPRLGINNPDVNGTLFSLRRELFRLLPETAGDAAWQQTLEQHIMSNVMADPDVAAAASNLRKPDGSAVPGIVIPFSTTVQAGLNFFGLPLAAGDHAFSVSNFATKIYSVGLVMRGYIGMDPYTAGTPNAGLPNSSGTNALSSTPYAYLIPTGTDYMLAPPLGDTGSVRAFAVHDQALPLPFNLGATSFSTTQFFNAAGTLSEAPWILRKHQAFRPVNDPVFFYGSVPAEFTSSRLVGRSVWNSGWKIVIPANTLLNTEAEGLNRFVASVKDLEIFLRTYSHSGN